MKRLLCVLATAAVLVLPTASAWAGYEFYFQVTGSRTGLFKGESVRASRTAYMTGLGYVLTAKFPLDVNDNIIGPRRYDTVDVTKEWGAASPQLLQAFATSEPLTIVKLEFVRVNAVGLEYVYQRVTLTNATIVKIVAAAGEENSGLDMNGRVPTAMALETISFRFQAIKVENTDGQTIFSDTPPPK